MQLRLLAIALAVLVAASGCTDKPKDAGTTDTDATGTTTGSASGTSSTTSTATGSSTSTATTAASSNQAPAIATFEANATGLTVLFTFNATDADGDALSYTLVFGDGTANATATQDGNATHAYAVAGAFNATLLVSDGKVTANQTVALALTAGDAVPVPPQTYSGETTVSVASCPESTLGIFGQHPYDPYPGGPLEGVEWLAFDVDPLTIGRPYEWSNGQVVPLIWGVGFAFYDAADNLLVFEIDGAGEVPAGAALGVFYPCGPGPIEVTYTTL